MPLSCNYENGPGSYLRSLPDFLDALATSAPLPPALRAALPARHQLLQPGLESGLVRGYARHEGREVSSWFMREGDFVVSIVSFLTQAPSTEYLALLEASVAHSIGHAHLHGLYRDFPEFNLFGRVITERYQK